MHGLVVCCQWPGAQVLQPLAGQVTECGSATRNCAAVLLCLTTGVFGGGCGKVELGCMPPLGSFKRSRGESPWAPGVLLLPIICFCAGMLQGFHGTLTRLVRGMIPLSAPGAGVALHAGCLSAAASLQPLWACLQGGWGSKASQPHVELVCQGRVLVVMTAAVAAPPAACAWVGV
jgi:hypothetical protein